MASLSELATEKRLKQKQAAARQSAKSPAQVNAEKALQLLQAPALLNSASKADGGRITMAGAKAKAKAQQAILDAAGGPTGALEKASQLLADPETKRLFDAQVASIEGQNKGDFLSKIGDAFVKIAPDVLKAYVSSQFGGMLGGVLAPASSAVTQGAIGGSLVGGGMAAAGGENILKGALLGGAGGALSGYMSTPSSDAGWGSAGDVSPEFAAEMMGNTLPPSSGGFLSSLAPSVALGGTGLTESLISSSLNPTTAGNVGLASGINTPAAGVSSALTGADIAGIGGTSLGSLAVPSVVGTGAVSGADAALGGVGSTSALPSSVGAGTSLASSLSGLVNPNTLGSLASGAAALYGSNQVSNSAADAAAIQERSNQAALAETKRQFDLGQAAQMPWRTAGETALGSQMDLMGLGAGGASAQLSELMKAPGYEFRMGEGQKALERSAAARGGLFGGAAGKALTRYGQDFASNEYGNRLSQLSSLSGQGQSAASNQAAYGQNYAGNVSNLLTGGANAQAASAIAQGNAQQSGILGAGAALSNLFNPPKAQPTLADLLKGGSYGY